MSHPHTFIDSAVVPHPVPSIERLMPHGCRILRPEKLFERTQSAIVLWHCTASSEGATCAWASAYILLESATFQ
jgi:hypothetical protein